MQNTVFECSICFNCYDAAEHLPLSLPCGHVFCLLCLQNMFNKGNAFCPADKIPYSSRVSELPCCHAILSNLPKSHPTAKTACRCRRHPSKKIKFMCEPHKTFLCSRCVLEHTGAGHSILPFDASCILDG